MTPTEQDKELQKAVWASLASQITHAINCTDPEHEKQDSCQYFTKKNFEQLMQLITADRKRVALEARLDEIERIDAANIDNGINFWFAHLKKQDSIENNNGWRTMRQYTPERIAELKAQQEEKHERNG